MIALGQGRQPRTRPAPRAVLRSLGPWLLTLLGALFLLPVIAPFVWMLSSALKPLEQIFSLPFTLWPHPWVWSNFTVPFMQDGFGIYFRNSAIVAAAVTAGNLVLDTLAAYAVAKFAFPGRRLYFMFILATMTLPLQVIVVPLFLTVEALGWLNSYAALIVPGLMSGFGVFLMHQFLQDIPDEMLAAARVDGAGEPVILWRVVLPLVRPALLTLGLFSFMASWDSFLWPLLVVTNNSLYTVPLGIASFEGMYTTQYGQLMAVAVAAMLPMLLIFLGLQRQFLRGLVIGSVKG
jgi:ABC-type glycerol-3-phosphate transport system permease component